MSLIDSKHLRSCTEHRVVSEGWCPVCETDAEPVGEYDGSVNQMDRRMAPDEEVVQDHLPGVVEAAEAAGGSVAVAVAMLPVKRLPAGYTRQERWFNVFEIRDPAGRVAKTLKSRSELKNATEQIESGAINLSAPDYDHLFDPDEWRPVFSMKAREVEFERVEEKRLRATASVPSEHAHSQLRREVGTVAENEGLSVHTRNAGNRFERTVLDIYIQDDS
ncbi:hypothetical protein ACFQDD_01960 [Halorubrum pallidum]|uniref:Uncharacterized protein n=1 Tax=Halorubrum pallidum TaxID=1526114 RepID=A0ABD5T0I0_9EURY